VKVYRDTLLPQAEAAFKASTAAYQNNRAEFLTLIDSQNLLLDIQVSYYKALSATDAGVAELERTIGAQIPETAGAAPAQSNTDSSYTGVLSPNQPSTDWRSK
jgi:outer membrane protein TolC